jgi:hypothetical protein
MAFMLPLAIGSLGTVSGFVAGYYYNTPDTKVKFIDGMSVANVTEKDLKKLKTKSPHKEIHQELLDFQKNGLRHVERSESCAVHSDAELIKKLRDSMKSRRKDVDPN